MKIHEYQAKEILKEENIRIPKGYICFSLNECINISKKIKYPCVAKAQVHAGGRGKGGGIKFANNKIELENFVEKYIGINLITPQTSLEGQPIKAILIEEACHISKELYLGFIIDREINKTCLIISSEGGMEIEEVAQTHPEKIIKKWISSNTGVMPFQVREILKLLNLNMSFFKEMYTCINGLYKIFVKYEASLVEINPLVISNDKIIALDAKMGFDENALFRLPDLVKLNDKSQENIREISAKKHNLSYIALDGNIGCLVNGAGLAMATMDIIKHVGGAPANFLDVGGSATEDNVKEALKIILQDANVKAILINVFGGIAKCDVIANGVIKAAKDIKINIPIIVRLEGTNVEEGKKILANSNIAIIAADNLLDAANKSIESIK